MLGMLLPAKGTHQICFSAKVKVPGVGVEPTRPVKDRGF